MGIFFNEQIAKRKEQLKKLPSYRRRPVSIAFRGLYYLHYETIDPDLRRGDDFLFLLR